MTSSGAKCLAPSKAAADGNEQEDEGSSSTPIAAGPDEQGFFGLFGGRFVAETLMPLILDLENAYEEARPIPLSARARQPQRALCRPAEPALLRRAADRTPRRRQDLLQARRAQSHRQPQDQQLPGPDPARTAHGQDPHHRGDRRRPHGVAVATVCARFGLPCEIFMGAIDVERQKPNVVRMKLLGAKVNAVTSGARP